MIADQLLAQMEFAELVTFRLNVSKCVFCDYFPCHSISITSSGIIMVAFEIVSNETFTLKKLNNFACSIAN